MAGVEVDEVGGDEGLGEHRLERRLARLLPNPRPPFFAPVRHQFAAAQPLLAAVKQRGPAPRTEPGPCRRAEVASGGVLRVGKGCYPRAGDGMYRFALARGWGERRPAP